MMWADAREEKMKSQAKESRAQNMEEMKEGPRNEGIRLYPGDPRVSD